MAPDDLYYGREQSLIKHIILREYLLRLAIVIGSKWETVTYVDSFAGPWNVRSEELADSSFSIALAELLKARAELARRGSRPRLGIRCYFLEKEPDPYARLQAFAAEKRAKIPELVIETKNSEFVDAAPDIAKFIQAGGPNAFSFLFVDPKGWTGFPMNTLRQLFHATSSQKREVLVNLMTSHILRFINEPGKRKSFEEWYGSNEIWKRLQGLEDQEKESELVCGYSEQIKEAGNFGFTCPAVILNPEKDEAHFYLIYGTHDAKGVEEFKSVERHAMKEMEKKRAEIEKKKREQREGPDLFPDSSVLYESTYYDQLRERLLRQVQSKIEDALRKAQRIGYDQLWRLSLTNPLIWESDLKDWIAHWRKQEFIRIEGMKPRQKVPHRGQANIIVWTGPLEH
jgi:three-Cys-motif partner protein